MTTVEIYVGSPIQYASERAAFLSTFAFLSRQSRPAILLANLNLSGRQIDLIIALDGQAIVVEAKGYNSAIRGQENGQWEFRIADGRWKAIDRNPYSQTLDARLAVRDALKPFIADPPYPTGALVFCPAVPRDSKMPAGDFKVSVIGLDELPSVIGKDHDNRWTLQAWRAFAAGIGVTKVTNLQSALDASFADAEQLVRRYCAAFKNTYQPLTNPLVHFTCSAETGNLQTSDLIGQAANGGSFVIKGAPGLGKSLLARHIGLAAIDAGRVPLFVYGRNFEGSFKDAATGEAALLDVLSAPELVRACRRLGIPILLLLDGYNECNEDQRGLLTRAAAAACYRLEASLVVTSQIPIQHQHTLSLPQVIIDGIADDTKSAIAEASYGAALPESLHPLLASVRNGLEAHIVGVVGRDLPEHASRHYIFDCYMRARLGEAAGAGLTLLSSVAALLSERIAFSLSVRDLERLTVGTHASFDLLSLVYHSGLLSRRGDRVSFEHEFFLDACTAEHILRRTQSVAEISDALTLPRNKNRMSLVVGGIEDVGRLNEVLESISDQGLLNDCLFGQCGDLARAWAERRLSTVSERAEQEAGEVAFEYHESGYYKLRIDPQSVPPQTAQDRAFCAVLAQKAKDGRGLDMILEAAAQLDRRLIAEFERLQSLGSWRPRELFDGLFANAYTLPSSLAVGAICAYWQGHASFLPLRDRLAGGFIITYLQREDLTYGQLYVLLILANRALGSRLSIAEFLPGFIERYWKGSAYHLRLALLDAAGQCSQEAPPVRKRLIEALEALPSGMHIFLSTTLIEALQSLGALEDSEQEFQSTADLEVREILEAADGADTWGYAFSIWTRRFDHPYAGTYDQAISGLMPEDQKRLLTMAAKGSGDSDFFVSVLMVELAAFGDPAIGAVIERWRKLPSTNTPMRQSAVANFQTAHIVLARLACTLTVETNEDASLPSAAFLACGQILYWLNRFDLSLKERKKSCIGLLEILKGGALEAAVDALREFHDAMHFIGRDPLPEAATEPLQISIPKAFPGEVAEMCRKCLQQPDRQLSYFTYTDRSAVLDFAIDALGEYGNVLDVPLLRRFADDRRVGAGAIRAINRLGQLRGT